MSSITPAFQTGHIGLNVSNLEQSKHFYQSIFGFSVTWESHEAGRRYAFLSDGQQLVLTLWEQSEGTFAKDRPGLHHLSFRVSSIDDVHVFEERLKNLQAHVLYDGVVPHGEGEDSGGLFFEDPDGIRLEIFAPSGASKNPAPHASAPTCGFF
ncbi:lactoylglutathione lyase [Dictyobacter sp. S3.2.2.5]|uniref:Lactoylglutathione lyase n=1 Tax=Dictyobacter halimunensis TaxID=3026934 RepID=A0ABQ6FKD9_9CHLR|nr:lactoylglutathione lyase [Dictyobacter sp. S3.2.2.5]